MASLPTALPVPQPGHPCACGSGKLFEACCGPLLAGTRRPASAEELMRSRFTAHVARNYAYLHRTYQPTSKLPYREESNPWTQAWTRLVIHAHEPGANPDTACVDFTAYFLEHDVELAHAEKSEFHRATANGSSPAPCARGPRPSGRLRPKLAGTIRVRVAAGKSSSIAAWRNQVGIKREEGRKRALSRTS